MVYKTLNVDQEPCFRPVFNMDSSSSGPHLWWWDHWRPYPGGSNFCSGCFASAGARSKLKLNKLFINEYKLGHLGRLYFYKLRYNVFYPANRY